jgi:hypothetical protein
MAVNAHRLFTGSTKNHYLAALTLERLREDELRRCRDVIRETLK